MWNENKRIPVLDTAQPRVYQYFVAWHEDYHLLYDKSLMESSHNISIDMELNDELVKPSYVVSIGNLERKIKKVMEDDSESSSHESNLHYLKQLGEHIQRLMKE